MNLARNLLRLPRSIGGLLQMNKFSVCGGSKILSENPLLKTVPLPAAFSSPLGLIGNVRGVKDTPLFRPPIDYNAERMTHALFGIPKKEKNKPPHILGGRNQMKGVVLKLMILHPRKPNSGNRKCCKVRLQNGKVYRVHIPGIGHSLQEHNVVMVRQGKTKDISLKLKVIRGVLDCAPVVKPKKPQRV